MTRPEILLNEKEVPAGVKVYVYAPGKDEPELYHKRPMILHSLIGGSPIRKKFYQLDPYAGDILGSLENFVDGVMFTPTQVFNLWTVPKEKREYVVYENGKPFDVSETYGTFRVKMMEDGLFYKSRGDHSDFVNPISLDEKLKLVPLGF